MPTDVMVPTLGESITEATLGQWLKKPGDAVAADEPIASLETDKVAVEGPAPAAGTMGERLGGEGDAAGGGALRPRSKTTAAAAAPATSVPEPERAEPEPANGIGVGGDIELRAEEGEAEGGNLTLSP